MENVNFDDPETVRAEALSLGFSIPEFDDPRLAQLGERVVTEGVMAVNGLRSIPYESKLSAEPRLTQEDIDRYIQEKVGQKAFEEADEASADMFDLLAIDDLDGKIAMIALSERTSRSRDRSAFGPKISKAARLLTYWSSSVPTLSPDDIRLMNQEVLKPVFDLAEASTSFARLESAKFSEIKKFHETALSVNPDISLRAAKMLIINGIVARFKDPVIIDAFRKGPKKEQESKLTEEPYGPIYRAAYYLRELVNTDPEKAGLKGWQVHLALVHDFHTRGRLLRIPSPKFKTIKRELFELSKAYLDLDFTQKNIAHNRERLKRLDVMEESTKADFIAGVIRDFAKIRDSSLNAAIDITSERSIEAERDEKPDVNIWENYGRLDDLCVFIGRFLSNEAVKLDLKLKPDTLEIISKLTNSKFRTVFSDYILKRSLAELEPEIKIRLEEFKSIDSNYQLSNKKLRERNPNLINNAKLITDLVDEGTTINEATARGLVGLMSGVYWERTGQKVSNQDNVEAYIEDIKRLRLLNSELDFLGKPQESQLLKLVNLLDELIDTGAFDDTSKHPELDVFTDFILAYLEARDMKDAATSSKTDSDGKDAAINTGDDSRVAPEPLPIDSLRQAVYEPIKVFPPGATDQEVIEDFRNQIEEADLPTIEWERIKKIIELKDQCTKQGLEVSFVRTKHASWQVLPFFILEVRLPNDPHSVAIIESPVYGNATYIYRESEDRLEWRDVVQLSRQEAREWGAVPTVHVDSKQQDKHFKKVWDRLLSELTVLR